MKNTQKIFKPPQISIIMANIFICQIDMNNEMNLKSFINFWLPPFKQKEKENKKMRERETRTTRRSKKKKPIK